MPSERRIEKLTTLIKEEVSRTIDREIEFPEDFLVTLTRVVISQDGRYAALYFSVLGGDPKNALEVLQKNVYHIQQMLNKRLRMRPVPKIRFAFDEEELRREIVEKSLGKLRKIGEL